LKILNDTNEVSNYIGEENRGFFEWDTQYRNLYKVLDSFSSRNESKLVSIVIPVYNEEKSIRKVLEQLPKHKSIEIILVDDHSTDFSLDEIKGMAAQYLQELSTLQDLLL
jgi:cellulose synthase/poly-beta-1,6-N-acetylglucosamine synthase-like glycosyltransferase